MIECGANAAGLAYWPCDLEGRWQTSMPDFSQCQSYWLQKLRGQLDKTADRQASIGKTFVESFNGFGFQISVECG